MKQKSKFQHYARVSGAALIAQERQRQLRGEYTLHATSRLHELILEGAARAAEIDGLLRKNHERSQ